MPDLKTDIARLDYEASMREAADRLRFQQEIGLAACKSVILVNGGAIIGLLTFIGNNPSIKSPDGLKTAVFTFACGIGCALFSLYCGYIGQEWLSNFRLSSARNFQQDMRSEPRVHDTEKERKRGRRLMLAATALVSTGMGLFVYGAVVAADAIL